MTQTRQTKTASTPLQQYITCGTKARLKEFSKPLEEKEQYLSLEGFCSRGLVAMREKARFLDPEI